MLNMKNIYAGTEVASEFMDKLLAVCREYTSKIQAVCPEDIISETCSYSNVVPLITRLQLKEDTGTITENELLENGFIFAGKKDNTLFYRKTINGIDVSCGIHVD